MICCWRVRPTVWRACFPSCCPASNNRHLRQTDDNYLELPLRDRILGCPLLPADTFRALCGMPRLPAVLGHLYAERHLVVAPLVATLMVRALSSEPPHDTNSSGGGDADQHLAMTTMMTGLVEEPALRPLWQDPRTDLVASVAAHVLKVQQEQHLADAAPEAAPMLTRRRSVLQALHRRDAAACERGIALAIQRMIVATTTNQDEKNRMDVDGDDDDDTHLTTAAKVLGPLLHDIVPSIGGLLRGKTATNTAGDNDDNNNNTRSMNELLPPRVALEHADAAVRLQAIQRLLDDRSSETTTAEAIDGSLLESLLRRWATDREPSVALSACEALCTWFEQDGVVAPLEHAAAPRVAELALTASHRWISSSSAEEEHSSDELVVFSLRAAAYTARAVARLGVAEYQQELWVRSLMLVVSLMQDADEGLAEEAEQCVLLAFDHPDQLPVSKTKKTKKSHSGVAKKLLLESAPFLQGLQRLYAKYSTKEFAPGIVVPAEISTCRRCVAVILDAILGYMKENDSSSGEKLAEDALAFGLLVVAAPSKEASGFTSEECTAIQSCLEKSLATVPVPAERMPDVLIALASAKSNRIWSRIADPTMQSLVAVNRDSNNKPVSAFTVLFEAVLRPNNEVVVVKRLVEKAKTFASSDQCSAPWLAIVPCLALLESTEEGVRAAAADLLQKIGDSLPHATKGRKAALDWSCLKEICQQVSSMENSAKMGGDSFLSSFLASCIRDSTAASSLQEALLSLCVFSTCSCGDESVSKVKDAAQQSWLTLGNAAGGCRGAAILLNAMELAGEDAFPLRLRWKFAGQTLLEVFLSETSSVDTGESSASVAKCVGRMLKGVTLTDPRVVIHTGPKAGRGGRARSYSVGKMDGVTFLTPYPTEMRKAIVDVLSTTGRGTGAKTLAAFVASDILNSKSWCEGIFKNLPKATKKQITSAILFYASSDEAMLTEELLLGLPLAATDLVHLLETSLDDDELTNESNLVEFVRANAETLSTDSDAAALVGLLFEHLTVLASNPSDDKDSKDFVVHSILVALGTLLEKMTQSNASLAVSNKKVDSWTKVLLRLLGADGASQQQQLTTFRSRSACLSLLVALCPRFTKRTVPCLVPAMLTAVVSSEEATSTGSNARDTFTKIVPAFLKLASASGLSLSQLLGPFAAAAAKLPDEIDKERLYMDLADATSVNLSSDLAADDTSCQEACVGAIQAFYLATEASNGSKDGGVADDAIGFAVDLLSHSSEPAQVISLLLLLSYAKELMSQFQKDPPSTEIDRDSARLLPSPDEIGVVAATGSFDAKLSLNFRKALGTTDSRKRIRAAIEAILRVFSDGLMLESIKKFIRRGEGEVSRLSLRLWQDLLLVQAASQIPVASDFVDDGDSEQFQACVLSIVNESREYLQGILPAHVFLASVSSLIQDGGTSEIRARALRLVADRISTLDPASPEASLFEDVLPIALEILDADKKTEGALFEAGDLMVVQSALVAIEHIARAFASCRSEGDESRSVLGFKYFLTCLQTCTELLLSCESRHSKDGFSSSVHDLISSVALCTTTLIRVVGAPCLPFLPKLMKPLFALLSSSNSQLASGSGSEGETRLRYRITQLSIMRALVAVIETVPQFVPPFLPDLLSPVTLSESLRVVEKDSSVSVSEIAQRFDAALATRVAPRLLIPAAAKALQVCGNPGEMRVLIAILKSSTEQASSSNVGSQRNALVSSVTRALEYDGSWDERSPVMNAACDLLDAVVLKLSEVQLRRVFDSIVSWRGELDSNDPEQAATRRIAFWTVTERLSKELRSLFLPCVTVVVDDMITELKLGHYHVVRQTKSRKKIGVRKQEAKIGGYDDRLQPRSDARAASSLGNSGTRPSRRRVSGWKMDSGRRQPKVRRSARPFGQTPPSFCSRPLSRPHGYNGRCLCVHCGWIGGWERCGMLDGSGLGGRQRAVVEASQSRRPPGVR